MTTNRRRLIAGALGRRPRTIVEIDVGYDFEVAIVDDEWVFRFPRRAGVDGEREVEIGPAVAGTRRQPTDDGRCHHASIRLGQPEHVVAGTVAVVDAEHAPDRPQTHGVDRTATNVAPDTMWMSPA